MVINNRLLGGRIRELREAKGIPMETVAKAAGLSVSRYTRIELGCAGMGLRELDSICDLLGVFPAELVRDATVPSL